MLDLPTMADSGKSALKVWAETSRAERTWWRNLIGVGPVRVLLRGQERQGRGATISGDGVAVAQALQTFLMAKPACVVVQMAASMRMTSPEHLPGGSSSRLRLIRDERPADVGLGNDARERLIAG